MAEYRGSLGGDSILPAKDIQAATAGSIKKGDFVTLDANGKLVKGSNTSASLVGVSEGINPQTQYDKDNGIEVHKVRFSQQAVYGTGKGDVTTPVVGKAYPIDANGNIRTFVTGDVETVKVVRVKSNEVDVVVSAGAIE